MPRVVGVLETSLYVEDLDRSTRFYQLTFGFPTVVAGERLVALKVSDRQVLLLFRKGASTVARKTPDGVTSAHDGSGQLHLAFAIAAADLPSWESWLQERGLEIENRTDWGNGSQSLYFRDPDQHLLELVTPGLWSLSW